MTRLIRQTGRRIFNINDSVGTYFLAGLWLHLSHQHENKFRQDFEDTLNTSCLCSFGAETTTHSYSIHTSACMISC